MPSLAVLNPTTSGTTPPVPAPHLRWSLIPQGFRSGSSSMAESSNPMWSLGVRTRCLGRPGLAIYPRQVNDAEMWLLAAALGAEMAELFPAASRRRPSATFIAVVRHSED